MGTAHKKRLSPRQLGKFLLSAKYIKQFPEKAAQLMGYMGMVVVEATMKFENDSIEYVAICDKFEKVPKGQRAPHYDLRVTENDEGEILTIVCIKID